MRKIMYGGALEKSYDACMLKLLIIYIYMLLINK